MSRSRLSARSQTRSPPGHRIYSIHFTSLLPQQTTPRISSTCHTSPKSHTSTSPFRATRSRPPPSSTATRWALLVSLFRPLKQKNWHGAPCILQYFVIDSFDSVQRFDIGTSGQQVHIAFPAHAAELADTSARRHPCFKLASPAALGELQARIWEHYERGGQGAPLQADKPGDMNSGQCGF